MQDTTISHAIAVIDDVREWVKDDLILQKYATLEHFRNRIVCLLDEHERRLRALCPGCEAWKSGSSEVAFSQECAECRKHMRDVAGMAGNGAALPAVQEAMK